MSNEDLFKEINKQKWTISWGRGEPNPSKLKVKLGSSGDVKKLKVRGVKMTAFDKSTVHVDQRIVIIGVECEPKDGGDRRQTEIVFDLTKENGKHYYAVYEESDPDGPIHTHGRGGGGNQA